PAGQLGPDLPQPHRAPRLEPEQFLVSGHPYLPVPGPELERGRDPDEVPAPCGQVADQGTPTAEEQAPERMQDRDDDLVWDDPERRQRGVCGEHRPQPAGLLPPALDTLIATPLVIDLGRGHADHPAACDPRPLREVETGRD